MYADNELSAADRHAVDNFILHNPDLAPELEALMLSVLPAEPVSFPGKAVLYKKDNLEWQEKMLLYLDGELPAEEMAGLLKAIEIDTALQKEWDLLRLTKLTSNEPVVFRNKALLYRHESSRLISMRLVRIAIAAVFIGAMLFAGGRWYFNRQQPAVDPRMANGAPNKSNNIIPLPANTGGRDQSIQPENVNSNQLTNINNIAAVNKPKGANQKTGPVNNDNQQKNNTSTDYHQAAVRNNSNGQPKNKINPPAPSNLENINNTPSNEVATSNVNNQTPRSLEKKVFNNEIAVNENKPVVVAQKLTAPDIDITAKPVNSFASTASIGSLQQEQDDSKVLFMDEEKVNRSKLSGFFRKVKRVVERKANIKPGKSFKIAGFEIAAK